MTNTLCGACMAAGISTPAQKRISVQGNQWEFCEPCYFDFLIKMNEETDKMLNKPMYYCLRCGHSWVKRTDRPKTCPDCRSPYWDRKKIR